MANDEPIYPSSWTGQQIDKAYEILQSISSSDQNKIVYINNNGHLSPTSFTQDSIAIKTSSWSEGEEGCFIVKNRDGKLSVSEFEPAAFQPRVTVGGHESIPMLLWTGKFFDIASSGLTVYDLRAVISECDSTKQYINDNINPSIEGIQTSISELQGRVDTIEAEVDPTVIQNLSSRVERIEQIIGSSTNPQSGTILYRLNELEYAVENLLLFKESTEIELLNLKQEIGILTSSVDVLETERQKLITQGVIFQETQDDYVKILSYDRSKYLGDLVTPFDDGHADVTTFANYIKFIKDDIRVADDDISITASLTRLDGNDVCL